MSESSQIKDISYQLSHQTLTVYVLPQISSCCHLWGLLSSERHFYSSGLRKRFLRAPGGILSRYTYYNALCNGTQCTTVTGRMRRKRGKARQHIISYYIICTVAYSVVSPSWSKWWVEMWSLWEIKRFTETQRCLYNYLTNHIIIIFLWSFNGVCAAENTHKNTVTPVTQCLRVNMSTGVVFNITK